MTKAKATKADETPIAAAITERVRERYATAAQQVQAGGGCCGDVVTSNLYAAEEVAGLPEEAVLASLGCGNPTALVDLHDGETVLDWGQVEVLMCCFQPNGWGKPGLHTGSI